MEGRFGEARELAARAAAILQDLGLWLRAWFVSETRGFVERLAGDLPAAERELREGYEGISKLEEQGYQSTVAALLAHVLIAQGRAEDAEAFIDEAAAAAADDDVTTGGETLCCKKFYEKQSHLTTEDAEVSKAREAKDLDFGFKTANDSNRLEIISVCSRSLAVKSRCRPRLLPSVPSAAKDFDIYEKRTKEDGI